MRRQDKAYLAGLIDGEGHIGISRVRTSKSAKGCKRGMAYRLTLSIRMTDKRGPAFALESTGKGSLLLLKPSTARPNRRPVWNWAAWSREAASVLREVLPFLRVKSEVVQVALEFQEAMRWVGRAGLSDAEWALREALYTRVKELNYGSSSLGPVSQ